MRKKLMSMLLSWALLALCLPFSTYAEEVDPGPFPVVEAGFGAENTIHILALDEEFQKQPSANYDMASVYYKKNDVPSPLYTRCPITWDFEQIDTSAPGFYTLDGIVELTDNLMPDDSLFPDGLVTVPLSYYVYDPDDPETKLSIDTVNFTNTILYNLEKDADVRSVKLPATASGLYSAGGMTNGTKCDIDWDYDSFDSSLTGKEKIFGTILPPDAFRLDEDRLSTGHLTLSCEIMVSDPEVPAQTVIIYGDGYQNISDRIIPLGMDEGELAATFVNRLYSNLEFLFVTEKYDTFFSKFEIDTTLIDITETGTYFPLIMELPAHAVFDQTVKNMTAVYVIDPNEIDLRCFEYDITKGYLWSSWFYVADSPELWVSVDDGDWKSADSDVYTFWPYLQSDTPHLRLDVKKLSPGHMYEFEVRYETDKYSVNTLVVDLSGGMMDIYETPVDGDRHGYDRDDGDTDNENGGTPGNGDAGNSDGSTPGDGDAGNSDGSTPDDGDAGNSDGNTPGDGDAGNSDGNTPDDGDAGNSDGNTPDTGDTGNSESGSTPPPESNSGTVDTPPQASMSDNNSSKGDAAQIPADGSHDLLTQPISVTIADNQPPVAGKSATPPKDTSFTITQTDLTEQTLTKQALAEQEPPAEPGDTSLAPAQNPSQPSETDTEQSEPQPPANVQVQAARSKPVSTALPIALGSCAVACGAAFLCLRKRWKP